MKLLSMQFFLQSPVTSSVFGLDILLGTVFSNTLSPVMSRDKVSHPYATTGKIRVLYIINFTFLDSRRKDKVLKRMVASITGILQNFSRKRNPYGTDCIA
jgi:hypothetical protein